MTAPLTPHDCDLRGLPYFLLDVHWARDSDFAILSTGAQFRAGFMLVLSSWHEVPAASIPNDDRALAELARVSLRRWRRMRDFVLQEWILCTDGRLYHPMVAERANAAWPKVQALRRRIIRRLEIMSEEWAALRLAVFKRDNFTCTYCGASGVRLQCDHIRPVARGGDSTMGNLTTACVTCNQAKGSKLVEEWVR